MTYTLIDSVTLATNTAVVTFSGIDQTYADLVLVVNATEGSGSGSSYLPGIRLNADSGQNYHYVYAIGVNNGYKAAASGAESHGGSQASTYTPFLEITHIMGYTESKDTIMLSRWNEPADEVRMTTTRWADTSSVTSVSIGTSGVAGVGSTFFLYGIEA